MHLLWLPFLLVLGAYCHLEKLKRFYPATALKVFLSAYVAVIAWYAAANLQSFFCYLMAIGLAFAVPADFFLQYIRLDTLKYRFGILFFGAMHVCLLTACFARWGIGWVEFALCAVLLVILTCFQRAGRWNLGKVRFQLSVYTVLVTLMASKSIAAFIAEPGRATLALALGGLFFFVSDLFLGIWNYYRDSFLFLALNRVIYFAGQLLFALSLLLML